MNSLPKRVPEPLGYAPIMKTFTETRHLYGVIELVGKVGFEPTSSRSRSECLNQARLPSDGVDSQNRTGLAGFSDRCYDHTSSVDVTNLVDLAGVEPTTSSMPSKRSPS